MNTNVTLRGGYIWQQTRSDGIYVPPTTYSFVTDSFTESRPDRTRVRKPSGWLYPKPYDLTSVTYRAPKGYVRTRQEFANRKGWFYHQFSGDLGSFIDRGARPQLPSLSDNLRRTAELKALTKLKDSQLNLGVALAEAQKTADFVGSTASHLANSARMVRKGNYYGALRELGLSRSQQMNLPKGWLGWNYAAKPLLNDVYNSVSALKKRSRFEEWVITSKGVVRDEVVSERLDMGSQSNHDTTSTVREKTFLGYFVRLDFIPQNDILASLANLGLTNPAVVAWELVPYSFVADWFVPIGEWLNAFDATVGFNFLSGSLTTRREASWSWVAANSGRPVGDFTPLGSSFSGRARTFALNRVPYSSPPLVALPRIKNPLSLGHAANGLALLAAALGGTRLGRIPLVDRHARYTE